MYELLKVSGIHKLNYFQADSLKKFLRGQSELQQNISSYPENLVRFIYLFIYFFTYVEPPLWDLYSGTEKSGQVGGYQGHCIKD